MPNTRKSSHKGTKQPRQNGGKPSYERERKDNLDAGANIAHQDGSDFRRSQSSADTRKNEGVEQFQEIERTTLNTSNLQEGPKGSLPEEDQEERRSA